MIVLLSIAVALAALSSVTTGVVLVIILVGGHRRIRAHEELLVLIEESARSTRHSVTALTDALRLRNVVANRQHDQEAAE